MAITATGLGSNLDVTSIISKLMSVEQAPLTALDKKEATYQARISALGSLTGTLSSLQSAASSMVPASGTTAAEKFKAFTATVADSNIASVTASSTAVAGTYTLEVTQLATSHRIATTTGDNSPFDSGGQLKNGGGTLTLTLATPGSSTPTKTTAVSIADGASAETIRDAINAANAGVSATVINGSNGKQLILSSLSAGSDQAITLSGIAGLSFDGSAGDSDEFTELQAAQGAAFKLNGVDVTATSNTVTTAIDGLTLNLKKESEDAVATTITVARDTSSLSSAVSSFVKAYNDFNTMAASLGSYNATTKVAGTLNGDSSLRMAQSILRSALGNVPDDLSTASLKRLSDIGVEVQKDGSLSLNETKLSTALKNDIDGVANLVASYGSAFNKATDSLIGTNGSIVAKTKGLNTSIERLDEQREIINDRLEIIEKRYKKQYSALDTLISTMTSTSDYLTTQLKNLSSYTLSKS